MVSDKRVGIFGGTFDPIHVGHLVLAEEARFQLQLDRVYFVPVGDPPHKQQKQVTSVEHRLTMVQLAIEDNEHFFCSRLDADRPGPHYTVDLVRLLKDKWKHQGKLYFLIGLDSLRDLSTWYKPEWLVTNCHLVAFSRPDVVLDWPTLEAAIPGLRQRVTLLPMPPLAIASHLIRSRIQAGYPIRYQVPRMVEEYIKRRSLYVLDSANI
ncbi:nicotinate-nucleotide adenylyltransferase [Chloroflexi bacterium TSY]|nr:nicotinate-nucleotide adenylyltransferase [Chloroflexi bacterium TSY]